MIPSVFHVRGLNGGTKMVNRRTLEDLRYLMDWQLRSLGYDPRSVNEACRKADGEDADPAARLAREAAATAAVYEKLAELGG